MDNGLGPALGGIDDAGQELEKLDGRLANNVGLHYPLSIVNYPLIPTDHGWNHPQYFSHFTSAVGKRKISRDFGEIRG